MAEFQNGLIRLQRVYGEKAFGQERAEVVYRAVKYVPAEVWEETVTDLIGDSMQPPNLTKIKDAMNLVRKRMGRTSDAWQPLRDQLREIEKTSSCRKCAGQGVFNAHYRDDPSAIMWPFLCDCPSGAIARQLPEHKRGKIYEWTRQAEELMRHDFEGEPPHFATREHARSAARSAIRESDLNVAIGGKPAPPRAYKDDSWEPDL